MASKNKPNELYITRVYNAPVKTVWEAWVDPEQVGKWWGPRGFTLTTKSKDVRTGGHWEYTMHGPDGTDYPNVAKYLEVDKYKRMVYDHGGTHDKPALFRVTVVFTEIKDKTKMEMTMALATEEAAKQTKKFIKEANGDSTWDRLAEYLDKESLGKEKFVINRSFHTNVETMYEMWTHPKHFSKWLSPKGSTMEFIREETKVGGTSFYFMTFDTGMKLYGIIKYKELSRPDKVVYTQSFADENENPGRHPMVPTWPATMLTTVTFTQEDEEHTRVRLEWEPIGDVTKEELAVFIEMRGGMTQGWTGSFDKLEEYFENKQS